MSEKLKQLWRETRGNVIVECCKYIGGATVLKSIGSALWRLFTHAPLYGRLLFAEFIVGLVFLISAISLHMAKRKPKFTLGENSIPGHPPTQKLKVISAVYGSHETDEVEDVTGTLENLIVNDTLSVLVGNDIFGDPAEGKAKRLNVSYSYGSSAIVRIERYESNRMVLPEDTFLKERASAKADGLLLPLQRDAIQLSTDLLKLLKRLGPPPAPKYTRAQIGNMTSDEMRKLIDAQDGDYAEACAYHGGDQQVFTQSADGLYRGMVNRMTRLYPYYEKVRASYALEFKGKVETLRNRFSLEGLPGDGLLLPVEDFKGEENVRLIAARLWELAYKLGEKGVNSENA